MTRTPRRPRRSSGGARQRRPSASWPCSASRTPSRRGPRSSPTSESKDTGKPRASLVEDEILLSVDQIRFFAGAARGLEGRAAGEYMKDHTSFIRREPIGVIGQVTPWNYPLNMAVWKFAPALAAGNTTVLKPSDTTPSSTLLLAEVAAEFLPRGCSTS